MLLAALFALAGCDGGDAREWRPSDHQQPQASDERGAADGSPVSSVADAAAALFRARCASCHGEDGHGATTAVVSVPDLTTSERTDEELTQVIRDGRGAMPGFGSELNDRGIAALVEHVRTLRAAP